MKKLLSLLLIAFLSFTFYSCQQEEVLPLNINGISEIDSEASATNSTTTYLTPAIVAGQPVYRGGGCSTCFYYSGYVSSSATKTYDRRITVTYSSGTSLIDQKIYTIKANNRTSNNIPIFQSVSRDFSSMKFKITSVSNLNGSSNNDQRREINYGSINSCHYNCQSSGGGEDRGGRQLFDVKKVGNDGGINNPGFE